jgi:hypothetical protein
MSVTNDNDNAAGRLWVDRSMPVWIFGTNGEDMSGSEAGRLNIGFLAP